MSGDALWVGIALDALRKIDTKGTADGKYDLTEFKSTRKRLVEQGGAEFHKTDADIEKEFK